MGKQVILTGLRTNAEYHLGNYLGAILPMVHMTNSKADEYQINMFAPDLHSFTTDGLYEKNNGPKKCEPLDDQIEKGLWKLNANETILTITDTLGANASDLNVKQLWSREIIIEYSEFENGVIYVFRETLTKQ